MGGHCACTLRKTTMYVIACAMHGGTMHIRQPGQLAKLRRYHGEMLVALVDTQTKLRVNEV